VGHAGILAGSASAGAVDTVRVADDNWFVPPFGAGWMDPAGIFTPRQPLLPAAALEALLRAAGRRLAGRRLTVPGTGGALRLRLTALRLDPEPIGMAIGQLGDLTVEAADVVWRTIPFRRAVLTARNVHVRPQPVPTAVAAPVTVDVVLDPAVLRDRVAAARPALRLEVHRSDGAPLARAHWARRPSWGWVGLRPEITATALLLRPTTVHLRGRSLSLPAWLPAVRIRLPLLPRGVRLRDVEMPDGADPAIVLRFGTDEWREAVDARRLSGLLARLQRMS
jgi:hypothetical protein